MKKNLNISDTKDRVSRKIGFTGDVILGATIVTIEGDYQLFIENYKGIVTYNNNTIVVQGHKNKILIEGKNLQIEYYTNIDMKIKGTISLVKYC